VGNSDATWSVLGPKANARRLAKGVLLNINFPDCEPEPVKGSAATVQGQRDPDMLRVDNRIDTRGRAYYWLGIQRRHSKSPEGTDIWAVLSNLISVTPSVLILRTNKLSPASNPSSTFRGRQTPKHFLFPKWTEPKPTLAGWAPRRRRQSRGYEFLRHSARNTRPHCGLNRVCPTQIAIA
jgi:hypothetical protein